MSTYVGNLDDETFLQSTDIFLILSSCSTDPELSLFNIDIFSWCSWVNQRNKSLGLWEVYYFIHNI